MTAAAILSFVAGVVLETIYAANVTFISDRRLVMAGLSALLWGAAFLTGIDASLTGKTAAAMWCVGLGVGTILGMKIANSRGIKE